MVNPSEIAVACQDLLAELVPRYLDQEAIQLVAGEPEETTMTLKCRSDQTFYSSSPKIAKVIAAAEAKHLTPTVLELGGQAPCIVTPSADIDVAAKRIVFYRYMHCGQVCLAANHVSVDPRVHEKFVERSTYWLSQYLRDDGKDHAVRIVNVRIYDRLVGPLNQTRGDTAYGGRTDRKDEFIQQTIVTDVTMHGVLQSVNATSMLLSSSLCSNNRQPPYISKF